MTVKLNFKVIMYAGFFFKIDKINKVAQVAKFFCTTIVKIYQNNHLDVSSPFCCQKVEGLFNQFKGATV